MGSPADGPTDARERGRLRAGVLDRIAVAAEPVANRVVYAGGLVAVVGLVLDTTPVALAGAAGFVLGIATLAAAFALRLSGRPRVRGAADAVPLVLPVEGRWIAVNSPADGGRGHPTPTHGQSRAIDLLHVPEGARDDALGWSLLAPRADAYPTQGRTVLAPAAGVVVRARDGIRDGRGRMTWPALAWMMSVEAVGRTAMGADRLLGNHVVLDVGSGDHVVLAHLERGSVAVRTGDAVRAGQPVARAGSSGNSAEPHLHLQAMDHPRPLLAVGVPIRFLDAVDDDGEPVALPADGVAVRARPPGAVDTVG